MPISLENLQRMFQYCDEKNDGVMTTEEFVSDIMYTNKFSETKKCNGLKHENHCASRPTDKANCSFVKVDNPGAKTYR